MGEEKKGARFSRRSFLKSIGGGALGRIVGQFAVLDVSSFAEHRFEHAVAGGSVEAGELLPRRLRTHDEAESRQGVGVDLSRSVKAYERIDPTAVAVDAVGALLPGGAGDAGADGGRGGRE